MSDVILEMRNITKTFPGVKALDNVSFSVDSGRDPCSGGRKRSGKIDPDECVKRCISIRFI